MYTFESYSKKNNYKFTVPHSSIKQDTNNGVFELANRTIEFYDNPIYSDVLDTMYFSTIDISMFIRNRKDVELLSIDDWYYLNEKYEFKYLQNKGGILIDNRYFIPCWGFKDDFGRKISNYGFTLICPTSDDYDPTTIECVTIEQDTKNKEKTVMYSAKHSSLQMFYIILPVKTL